jgi:hypothetical protein
MRLDPKIKQAEDGHPTMLPTCMSIICLFSVTSTTWKCQKTGYRPVSKSFILNSPK